MARQPDVRYIQFYTDGSAARKLEPEVLRSPAKHPRPVRRKQVALYVDPLAIAGIVVAVVMAVLMLAGVLNLRAAQQEATVMETYVEKLQEENRQLQKEFESGYDLEEVAWIAQALGLVPQEDVKHMQIIVSPVD